MSEPGAAGAAGDAQVTTGPAEPPEVRLAYAEHDADVADEAVERMRSKLAKAQAAPNPVQAAEESLAAAEAEAAAAHEKADAIRAEMEG